MKAADATHLWIGKSSPGATSRGYLLKIDRSPTKVDDGERQKPKKSLREMIEPYPALINLPLFPLQRRGTILLAPFFNFHLRQFRTRFIRILVIP